MSPADEAESREALITECPCASKSRQVEFEGAGTGPEGRLLGIVLQPSIPIPAFDNVLPDSGAQRDTALREFECEWVW